MFKDMGGSISGGEEPKVQHFEADPATKVRERDTKIGEILKMRFKGLARREEDLTFLVFGAGRDVSFTRGWNTLPENFTFIEGSGSKARFLQNRDYSAKKKNAEVYMSDKPADIVVALDEDISATWRFLRNVAPGGYMLCRADVALAARRTGKFKFEGLMSVHGNNWAFLESKEYNEVENDEEFQKAPHLKDAVSYAEAKDVLEKLGRPTGDVYHEYQKLIEEALEQNENAFEDGETVLPYTDEKGHTVDINTVLPPKHGDDEDIYILRKNPNA